jgi:uncharacterized membrane protein
MKEIIKNNWMSLVLIVIGSFWGLSNFENLPPQIPTHFDINGNADKYSSKEFTLWLMPLISLFFILVINGLLKASPEKFSANQSMSAVSKLSFGIVMFLMVIHVATIKEAIQPGQWMTKALPLALGGLTIFIGNYLGKLEKNFIIGVRLPWTITSDENWKRTHRFAGKCYFVAGAISLSIAFIYPNLMVSMGLLLLASLSSVIYSYQFFKKYDLMK